MKIYKYIIFLLLLNPVIVFAQDTPKENNLMSYEKFFKDGMRKIDGIIPVYTDDSKYYIEISENLLGRDFLATGVTKSGANYCDFSTITDILTFVKGRNGTLDIIKKFYSDRISEDGDKNLKEALVQSSMQPTSFSYKIVALSKNGEGYIIDITNDLTINGNLFSFPNRLSINNPVANRSGVESINTSSIGVEFLTYRSQTNRMEVLFMPNVDMDLSTRVQWGLMVLPKSEMRSRFYDARVGFEHTQYNDYSAGNSVKKSKIIRKWDLDVKPEDVERYKQGELVEPKRPIEIYIGENVPKDNYPIIKRVVDEWNECFKSAGFRDVLKIQSGKQDIIFAPHQILITCSGSTSIGASVNSMSNPTTGERIGGVIVYSVLSQYEAARNQYLMLRVLNPKMNTNDTISEIAAENIRWDISIAMSKMLGLTQNLMGSYAYTSDQLRDVEWLKKSSISASITDICPINFVIQPTDKQADLTDLYPHPSHYDRWAIEWAYRVFPDNINEEQDRYSLQAHLDKQKTNPFLLFSNDQLDSRSALRDIGKDRVKCSELMLKNIKLLYGMSDKFATELDEYNKNWRDYLELITAIDNFYDIATTNVMYNLNGITISPVFNGMKEEPIKYLTKKQMQETINFLGNTFFSDPAEWLRDERLAQVNGNLYNGSHSYFIGKIMEKLFDPIIIGNMINAEQKMGKNAYTTRDLHNDIKKFIFKDFVNTEKLNQNSRNLQLRYINSYVEKIRTIDLTKTLNDVSVTFMANYRDLYNNIKSCSINHTDEISKMHYKSLLFLMGIEK